MKKYVIFLVGLSMFFINVWYLKADCEEMLKQTEDIKVYKVARIPKYSEIQGEGFVDDFLIGITIEGLDDRFYAVVTNDYNDNTVTVRSEDNIEGKIEVSTPYIYKSVKMTVNIYSNDSNVCSSTDVLKAIQVDTDIFNKFYYMNTCNENSELDECQPIYDNSKYDDEVEFKKDVAKIIEERDKSILVKILDFLKKYILYIVLPIILISVFYITRIIILKRRMKNE